MTPRLRTEEEMVIEQPLRSTDEGKVKLDFGTNVKSERVKLECLRCYATGFALGYLLYSFASVEPCLAEIHFRQRWRGVVVMGGLPDPAFADFLIGHSSLPHSNYRCI